MSLDPLQLGVDFDDWGGTRGDGALAAGIDCLINDLAARLLGTSSILVAGEKDYGLDIEDYVNDSISQSDLAKLASDVQHELIKDPRVDSVGVNVTYNPSTELLEIAINGTCGQNVPFSFVAMKDLKDFGGPITFVRNY